MKKNENLPCCAHCGGIAVFKKSNINPYAKIFCSACGISTLYGPEDLVISTWTRREKE